MPIDAVLLERIKANDPTLLELNLANEFLTDSDIQLLAEALSQNTVLTTLNLDNNQIGDKIAQVLKDITTLTTLNLRNNQIGDTGKDIAQMLKNNINLTTFDLSNNQIGNTGVKDIAQVLKNNTTLTTLNLSWNQIEASGAKDIANALKNNTTLTALDLHLNSIGNIGGQALAKALNDNTTLTTLNLFRNRMGNKSAEAFLQALKHNTTLTILNLDGNPIGEKWANELKQAIEQNCEQKKRQIIQRRDKFIQAVITLARAAENNTNSQSFWSQLPKDVMLYIISFINFRSKESIEKSAKQIYDCAVFIFTHISELNASLAESMKTGQNFKIKEKIVQGGDSQFRFFPPPQQAEPLIEKTIEPFDIFQKNNLARS